MNDNFSDDIREYDSDPSSPFYEEPLTCLECDGELTWTEDEEGYHEGYCPDCELTW